MYKRIVKWFLIIVGLYLLLFGVVIFSFGKDVSQTYINTHSVERFYDEKIGPDRAIVIDSMEDAHSARIHLIENAQQSLDISYYSVEPGHSTDVFWGLLVEAADRGVKVRIILDGIANGVRSKQQDIMFMIKNHPNMELKFYELPNVWKPWTFNNRLHDKYIIADHMLAILGGRNIGDRFLASDDYEGERAYDRDVLVYHANDDSRSSVITDLSVYFNEVYDSPYAKQSMDTLSKKEQLRGREKEQQLHTYITEERQQRHHRFRQQIDWKEITLETNKITLIRNPIHRFNKEPWVLYEVFQLLHTAKQEIVMQSPYIVPTKKMKAGFLYEDNEHDVEMKILTNSRGSTPNYPAFSVYLRYRDDIVASGAQLYEYQGNHSIHTKSYMVDDDISMIGSFNLDPRSAYLSTETMMVIHSKEVRQQIQELTDDYLEQSLLVDQNGAYQTLENNIPERPVSWFKFMVLMVVGFLGKIVAFLL